MNAYNVQTIKLRQDRFEELGQLLNAGIETTYEDRREFKYVKVGTILRFWFRNARSGKKEGILWAIVTQAEDAGDVRRFQIKIHQLEKKAGRS